MISPSVVHPIRDAGFFHPRTDIQPAVLPSRWTWWRILAVLVAIFCAAYTVFDAVASLLRIDIGLAVDFQRAFTGGSAISERSGPYRAVQKIAIDMIMAAFVLVSLWVVAGRHAVGLQRRARGEYGLAVGAAARGAYLVALTSSLSAWLLYNVPLSAGNGTPPWLMVLILVNAGITEEIMLTVLPYWLLEQIRTRSGKPVAHTAIGTVLIVAIWWALHVGGAGLFSAGLVLIFYFKLMLWRYTKNLPVLIGLHAGWNLATYLGAEFVPRGYEVLPLTAQFVLVGLAVVWETRSARAATGTTTQLSVTTTTTIAAAGSDRAQADQEARHA
jgi:hypothetical protein